MATLRFVVIALLASGLADPTRQPLPADVPADVAATIQRWVAQREYQASDNGVGLQAPNRAHELRSYFEPTGVRVVDRSAEGSPELVTLRLSEIRRGAALASVPEGIVASEGARVAIRRPGVIEWYLNSAEGLEQGFTLDARPDGAGSLALELEVGAARAALRGDRVVLYAESGRTLEYAKLAAFDATGRTLPSRFESPRADRLRLVVDDAGAQYPITIDPLLTGVADATYTTAVSNARLGASVASAGDINGDGYGDAIVGAPLWDSGQNDEGAAFLYLGGPTGLGALAATLQGNQISGKFGSSVAAAGDVNGDGYADVIVGAPEYNGSDTDDGSAFVFHGSAAGIANGNPGTAAVMIVGDQFDVRFGGSVAGAGDVNGDGYADVIVGARFFSQGAFQSEEGGAFVFHGSPDGIEGGNPSDANATLQSNQTDAQLGASVAGAGDVNGDGYSDVIVGANFYTLGQIHEGAAFVFHGGASGVASGDPSTANATFQSDQDDAEFGMGVAGAGDVNGDGYGDVIVGSYLHDLGETDEGAAFVFHGSAAGLVANGNPSNANTTLQSNRDSALMGRSVAGAGDVDGDGYADVIVGSENDEQGGDDNGAVYVFRGGTSGVSTTFYSRPSLTGPSAEFGSSVSGVGDVNGDGFSDIIIGSPNHGTGGTAFVLHGGGQGLVSGTAATAARSLYGDQSSTAFGISLAAAGDVNGDGYGDLIVGAFGYDGGHGDEGAAYVFHGGATGIVATGPAGAASVIEANQANAWLGIAVSSAGDVNGDGYDDVIVGASQYTQSQSLEGAAFVFHGSGTGIVAVGNPGNANAVLRSNQIEAYFGRALATAGDVNGDGYGDVIVGSSGYDNGSSDEGAGFVFHGSASGLVAAGTPGNANALIESNLPSTQLGLSVAGVGDVNADGYADVAIGTPYYSNPQTYEGVVLVFHGGASGVVAIGNPSNANALIQQDQNFAYGGMVAGAGDVNGDGYGDVIVGAQGHSAGGSSAGAAFVYNGGASGVGNGTPGNADSSLVSNVALIELGGSVAGAGDVNGDGFADVVVGAHRYSSGQANEGAAFVFKGATNGIQSGNQTTAAANFESNQEQSAPGHLTVAGIGDVNGDGFADIGIGQLYALDGNGNSVGGTFLHYGAGNSSGRSVRARQLRGGGSSVNVAPWGVSNSNSGFDVRLFATHPGGRGRVKLQVQVCPVAVAFGHASCATHTQGSWTAIVPPSTSVTLTQSVTGLATNTLRRWRARVLHAPTSALVDASAPAHGPWRRLRAQSREADVRTANFPDTDLDGIVDPQDNCPSIANPAQTDTDSDGQGDACDADDDGDSVLDVFETDTGSYVSPGNTGSDPLDRDSDDDGFDDGFEVRGQANPNDALSRPLFLGFEKLDGGQYFSCGVLTNGELACFGNAPSGIPSGTYTSVTTGNFLAPYFACALASDDTISCWGGGPAAEPPSAQYLQIAAGGDHVCGLLPDLTLECWGSDAIGQASPPPGQFTEVSAGIFHSCALGLDGSPYCWGSYSGSPIEAPTGHSFTQIVSGNTHSCGLRADGSVFCWGENAVGQLDVPPGTFTQIVTGGSQNCGILTSGEVLCWGSNTYGQTVGPSGVFASVFAGPNHTCGVRPDHFVECWGRNFEGQSTPPILPFPDVAFGEEHGCELTPDRRMRCFGKNDVGQASPPALDPVASIVAGAVQSCAVGLDGDVVCFGANWAGQAESQSASGNPFVQVDGGGAHNCGVRATGSVTCWGSNFDGEGAADAGTYAQVSAGGIEDGNWFHSCGVTTAGAIQCWGANGAGESADQSGAWRQVSAGYGYSCGIRSDLTLACWGGFAPAGQPASPPALFTQVETGNSHACALDTTGTVRCWGNADDGKTVPPRGRFVRISVGSVASCGVLEDGSIACWGFDVADPSPALDVDDDNRAEGADNCPLDANFTQADADADAVGDDCDLCANVPDFDQFDRDADGIGDACDNCPGAYNPGQEDVLGGSNGIGDACDDTLVIIRPSLPPPPPGPPPGAPFGPGPPAPPPAGEALYDVLVYCPAFPIAKVQLGVIMPEGATAANVDFGLGCTPTNCAAAVGNGLGAMVNAAASFAKGPDPAFALAGARGDTVYFSVQANPGMTLCDPDGPELEVRVAQFEIANPLPDMPTPSLTKEGLSAPPVNLLEPLTDDTGRVLEPAEYAFASLNQDPSVAITLEPAAGDTTGRRWQVELDTDIELHRVTFGLVAPAGTTTAQMRFLGCTTPSGPQPTRRSCAVNAALGPYVNPPVSYTVGPGASTPGLRTDTLYVSVAGLRPSGAAQPALNIAPQPVLLGVVELDTSTVAPALTLDGVGTTTVFGTAYVNTSNTAVGTPLVQVGSGYNAPSDYDADGRSDDLDNCPYTANLNQANNGGFLTTTPDLYGDMCQCADGDGNGAVFAADTAALRAALTGQASAAVVSRCSVAGGPECDVRDYAVFRRAIAGLGPGISSVCASAVQGTQAP